MIKLTVSTPSRYPLLRGLDIIDVGAGTPIQRGPRQMFDPRPPVQPPYRTISQTMLPAL